MRIAQAKKQEEANTNEKEDRKRKRIEAVREIQERLGSKPIEGYNKATLQAIEDSTWNPDFKARSIKFYREAHDAGVEFSKHEISRVMDRARKVGLDEKDIIATCKGRPSYIQSDGRLVYNAGRNIYIIQNPETGDFVSCVKRDYKRRDWVEIDIGR